MSVPPLCDQDRARRLGNDAVSFMHKVKPPRLLAMNAEHHQIDRSLPGDTHNLRYRVCAELNPELRRVIQAGHFFGSEINEAHSFFVGNMYGLKPVPFKTAGWLRTVTNEASNNL